MHPKVVLLDFASEKNRGDAAMQVSLIQLSKKYFNQCTLSVITVFGTNQHPECLSQFDHTYPEYGADILYYGGFLTTFDTITQARRMNKYQERFGRIACLLSAYFFIILLFCRIPYVLWSWLVPKPKQQTLRILREADYIIWNGRNFRGYTVLGELLHVLRLLVHPLICISLNKPMVCLGASVWELKSNLSKKILLFVFGRCQSVTLRERFSYEYISKLVKDRGDITRYEHVPDLSLYLLSQFSFSDTSVSSGINITMTIVGRREVGSEVLYDQYIQQHRKLITHLIQERQVHFTIVPQVIFEAESNNDTIESIFQDISPKYYRNIKEVLSVEGLTEIYGRSDILVASRMHSAIFALTQNVPVLAIAYDEGAKWNILTDMGSPADSLIKMSDISSVDLISHFNTIYEQKDEICKQVSNILKNKLYPAVEVSFAEAKQRMEESYERK